MRLKGKVALVTGAGSGIGRAIAMRFSQEGASLFLNDFSADGVAETKARIGAGIGLVPRILLADVSVSSEVERMFSELDAASDRIDILVNNAGFAQTDAEWERINRKAAARRDELAREGMVQSHWDVTVNMDLDVWRRMMAVHLDGTFFCSREALRRMSVRDSGSIINLSSTAALAGLAEAPHYAAAKAGVLGFTRSVAREVGTRGIRVNAIAPGYVETPMTRAISPETRAAMLGAIPLGRWGKPEELANVACFLASDEASYITGQCVSPNGGLHTG